MSVLQGLLDLILPPICLACDQTIAAGDSKRLVCRRCRTLLRAAPPPTCPRCAAPRLITGREQDDRCEECREWPPELVRAASAFLMYPPADRIVHQLKYRGWAALAEVMAEAMVAAAQSIDAARRVDVVMPVPTTESRLRERGYNQAELLARTVANRLNRNCELIIERTTSSSTQTTLQPAARGANVAGAFRLRSDAVKIAEKAPHVLIVDDVLTTGATVIECTRTLFEAGARCTSVLTYARAVDARRLLA